MSSSNSNLEQFYAGCAAIRQIVTCNAATSSITTSEQLVVYSGISAGSTYQYSYQGQLANTYNTPLSTAAYNAVCPAVIPVVFSYCLILASASPLSANTVTWISYGNLTVNGSSSSSVAGSYLVSGGSGIIFQNNGAGGLLRAVLDRH